MSLGGSLLSEQWERQINMSQCMSCVEGEKATEWLTVFWHVTSLDCVAVRQVGPDNKQSSLASPLVSCIIGRYPPRYIHLVNCVVTTLPDVCSLYCC